MLDGELRLVSATAGARAWLDVMPAGKVAAMFGILPAVIYPAATLARIRETLKPGGVAVFSECVRPFPRQPIYVEFVFNFLENFTGVATDPDTRPNHGFLTPENWRRALRAAGFEKPEILPDVEELARHYDAFFVAAVSGRRPAG